MKMNKVLIGKEIPVAVLRNNYINGVDKYNYEKFMVDFTCAAFNTNFPRTT